MRSGTLWRILACNECGCYYPYKEIGSGKASGNDITNTELSHRINLADYANYRSYFPNESISWRLKRFLKPFGFPLDARYFLRRYLRPSGSALDVGAADGRFCYLLQQLGYESMGIEPLDELATLARKNNLRVFTGYFPHDIPDEIQNQKFSLISAMESLYYMPDIREALAKMNYMLEPGGHVLIKALNSQSTYFRAHGHTLASRYGDNTQAMPNVNALQYWLIKSGFRISAITGGGKATHNRLITDFAVKITYGLSPFGINLFDVRKAEALVVLAQKIQPA
ncbi:MAG: class I SAM-dependent methyltransferase [Rhodospirillaceae bacterium]|jgi:2-polyprenyl-3-methyl-5-hydroxy-6-metoxy-1,4-benzoquinol methylase